MKLVNRIIASVLVAIIFLSSCSSTLPIIAVPVQASADDEIKIAKLTQMLSTQKFDAETMVRIYVERGLLYDSLGFSAFAQSDFLYALNYNNKIPDIYNFLGIRALMDGDVDSALFSLNTALELDENYSYAYLNRAITLYRTGHYYSAQRDALKFYAYNKNEPITILWLYLIESEIDKKAALNMLQKRYDQLDDKTVYSSNFIAFYLGNISESQMMQNIQEGVEDNIQLAQRLCETYFYLGKYYQSRGDNERAKMLFKYALANNIYNFVEHQQALYEIKLLDEK